MGGKWKRPPGYVAPGETARCTQCGRSRRINAGFTRKTKNTGLCRDCWYTADWQCPQCGEVTGLPSKGAHLKNYHPKGTP